MMLTEILSAKGPVLIKASAGTGKTYTLTKKVIHLILEEELDVDKILALTFTDYAAAEMRERIYSAITKALREEQRPQRKRHLERQRIQFHRNQISTFHGFCFNLIRSYPDVAGLQTEIRLMDTFQEAQFKLEVRARFYKTYATHPALNRVLMRYGQRQMEALCDAFGDVSENRLLELMEMTPETWLAMQRTALHDMIRRRDEAFAELRDHMDRNPDVLKKPDAFPSRCPSDPNGMFTQKGTMRAAFLTLGAGDPRKEEIDRLSLEVNAERDWIAALEKWLATGDLELTKELSDPDTPSIEPDTVIFHAMKDVAGLVRLHGSFFRSERLRTGQLIYDDLIHLAHRMTKEHPEWVSTMRAKYRYIVVDEFQDTDAVQWDILSSLLESETSDILMVGDVKQAIYEFRGGNVAVMRRVATELAHTEFNLEQSWRSAKEIVEGLNTLFAHVLRKTSDAIYEAEPQDLRHPGDVEHANKDRGSIRTFTLPALHKEDGTRVRHGTEERTDVEARSLARFLKGIADGKEADYADIHALMSEGKKAVGVLLPRRSNQWKFEQCLRDAGLPFSSLSGVGFYQSQIVRDALALTRFLADAYQNLACVAVFRSPFVGFSDDALVLLRDEGAASRLFNAVKDWMDAPHPELSEADRSVLRTAIPWLMGLRKQVKSHRVSEILHEAFFERAYLEACQDRAQAEANVHKLLRIVRDLERHGTGSLVDLEAFLTRQMDDDAMEKEGVVDETGSIQFMTIHGSKGLEFPMVVLPDLGSGKPNDRFAAVRSPRDVPDAETWIIPKGVNNEEVSSYHGAMYHHVRNQVKLRESAEQKRMFYVAGTRARNHLVFWGLEAGGIDERKGSLGALIPMEFRMGTMRIPIPQEWVADLPSTPRSVGMRTIADRAPLEARLAEADRIVTLPSKAGADGDAGSDEVFTGVGRWATLEPRKAGDLIHKALEHSGWMQVDWSRIERLVRRLWPHPSVDPTDFDAVMAHVRRAVAALAARYPNPRLRRHEVAFETSIKGVIDLLVQDEGGAWHIVDFKTGGVQAHLEGYQTQLELYREALRELGISVASMSLLETETGEFFANPFPSPD